jgi:hypothetical protein
MQFLDVATLLTLFSPADPSAVRTTIEAGGWSGSWPGSQDWEHHGPGEQLLSLALHYFTVRHPTAHPRRIGRVAQLLASHAVFPVFGYTVDESAEYQQAEAWLMAMAGGVPRDATGVGFSPPLDGHGQPVLPGGDIVTFTGRGGGVALRR